MYGRGLRDGSVRGRRWVDQPEPGVQLCHHPDYEPADLRGRFRLLAVCHRMQSEVPGTVQPGGEDLPEAVN